MYSLDEVKSVDPEIAQAIEDEMARQNSHIELIASENWVSKAVMAAMGSPCGRSRASGYRACQKSLWLNICQCTASLRRAGEHGRIFCYVGAGR